MEHLKIRRGNSFEVLILSVLILTGVPQLFSGPVPNSIGATMPGSWHIGWLAAMLVGSVVTLYGTLTKNVINGIYIERSGIPLVALALSVLGASQVVYAGSRAVMSAAIVFAMVASFLARRHELNKVVSALPKKE